MMKRTLATPILALILLAPGCATHRAYPGPKRPAEEVAVLSVPFTPTRLDGTPIEQRNVGRIELLPGGHGVEWEFVYPNGYAETRRLHFVAEAGQRYRLGHRFFPAPHPGGPIGALVELAVDTAMLPLTVLIPGEPATEPPPGEYFAWIVEEGSDRALAGVAPDVPLGHSPITYVPLDEP